LHPLSLRLNIALAQPESFSVSGASRPHACTFVGAELRFGFACTRHIFEARRFG
jgi:hypothetical protein